MNVTCPMLVELLDGGSTIRLQYPLRAGWKSDSPPMHARRELLVCRRGRGFLRGEEIPEGRARNEGAALQPGDNAMWGSPLEALGDGIVWLVQGGQPPFMKTAAEDADAPAEPPSVVAHLKAEVDKLRGLMTKQYRDDRRAERVRDEAQKILERWQRKYQPALEDAGYDPAVENENEWCVAMADLATALNGDEPAVSWEVVKAEIDHEDALRDRIGKLEGLLDRAKDLLLELDGLAVETFGHEIDPANRALVAEIDALIDHEDAS